MRAKIHKSILSVFVLAGFLMGAIPAPAAESCSCLADPYTKKYDYFKRTWYGSKRKWTCVYTCQNAQQKRFLVTGTHKDWYTTDNGLEGICEGLHYVNLYNSHRKDFVWKYDSAKWFDPSHSTAPELKAWAVQNCQ